MEGNHRQILVCIRQQYTLIKNEKIFILYAQILISFMFYLRLDRCIYMYKCVQAVCCAVNVYGIRAEPEPKNIQRNSRL